MTVQTLLSVMRRKLDIIMNLWVFLLISAVDNSIIEDNQIVL